MDQARSSTKVFGSVQEVARHVAPLRRQGKKLVTTNGCFDIIHTGHISCLYKAASLGDILAVGINSDRTTRKLKGAGRPVQTQSDRLSIVAALEMVDCAFVFEEDDPREFLRILKPDIHVKGGDYPLKLIESDVVEANGGRVVIVPFLKNRSTSGIVAKTRSHRPKPNAS
jgi:rfaE bifunctional protein nucleotidyltransferase chain/domain